MDPNEPRERLGRLQTVVGATFSEKGLRDVIARALLNGAGLQVPASAVTLSKFEVVPRDYGGKVEYEVDGEITIEGVHEAKSLRW